MKGNKGSNISIRIPSIDFYRGIAVIAVVLFHFDGFLPYGYLGVDLFFVISGYLVGGILVKSYLKGNLDFLSFFLKRAFKIFPSYYFFIIVGGLLAYFMYSEINPEGVLPLSDLNRYLFFYRNYTGEPHHWNFDHVWSLCIEEHFYLLFPITLILCYKIFGSSKKTLLTIVLMMLVFGFVFKNLSLFFTNGHDTYSATHNRIDALGYGVLLYILSTQYQKYLTPFINKILIIGGLLGLIVSIYLDLWIDSFYYNKTVFHSIVPLFLSAIILGSLANNFSKFGIIKRLAAKSYNLYLWHPLFVFIVMHWLGSSFLGLITYLLISFMFAFFATKYIEIPFLNYREKVVSKTINFRNSLMKKNDLNKLNNKE